MSAVEIALKRWDEARERAKERQRIIEEHHPDIAAFVKDVAKHLPGAKLVKFTSPELNWQREGAAQFPDPGVEPVCDGSKGIVIAPAPGAKVRRPSRRKAVTLGD